MVDSPGGTCYNFLMSKMSKTQIRIMAEFTALQAAHIVGVSRRTILRWCWAGLIQSRQRGRRGDWRIDVDELRRFAAQYGYDFDEELARKLTGGQP